MAPPRRLPAALLRHRVQVALTDRELSQLDIFRSVTGETRSAYLAAPLRSDLRCLTVRQPWATLLARGLKSFENRSRDPGVDHGRWIAIHAGLADHPLADLAQQLAPGEDLRHLPRGAIIGLCWMEPGIPLAETANSPWAMGPVCLRCSQALEIDPILCHGALGLWRPTVEIRAAIEQQVGPL